MRPPGLEGEDRTKNWVDLAVPIQAKLLAFEQLRQYDDNKRLSELASRTGL